AHFHLAGPHTKIILDTALSEKLPPLNELDHLVRVFAGNVTASVRRRDALGQEGYDIVCSADQATAVWDLLLQAAATPAGNQAYDVLRIEAGPPEFGSDIDENTFAPEVGRTAQAISYTKGCYLGQEPIVMARDRGQVNRALLGLRLSAEPAPHGSRIFHE